jgi:hypothetical protein
MKDGIIRKYVREFVAMAQGYGCTEAAIYDSVNERVPGKADLSQVRQAIEWNLAQDYIRGSENVDTDEYEWRITSEGIAKESIK